MNTASSMVSKGPPVLVSVVLPAYKMGPYIQQALDSVAAQTHTNWEVLVVDDLGPEDGTATIVQDFADRMRTHRVEMIRHVVNQGVSAARNTGVQAASGDLVAFLDPDDLWLPHHLAEAVAAMTGSSGADVACAPVESFRDEQGRSWTHKAWIEEWKSRHFPLSLAIYNFILPSATVVRRSAILAIGGFDTDPEIQHIEDYDLWIRLVGSGARFNFQPTISCRYRKHGGGATAQEEKFSALHERLYAKHPEFFREGQRRMMRITFDELTRLRAREQGPLMAAILWIDGAFQRLVRKFGGGDPDRS